jgi:MinD superfamily P-loop ATPase
MNIAIASGKGGTGKTLLSTNLFHVLQAKEYKVNLIDCDAEEPNDMLFFQGEPSGMTEVTQKVPQIDTNKCTYCGLCHQWCAYNAIFFLKEQKIIKVLDDLCHGCGACSVACKFGAITEKDVVLGEVQRYRISKKALIVEARLRVGVYTSVPVLKEALKETQFADISFLDSPPGTSCPFIQTAEVADYVILITEPTPFGLSDLRQSVETLKTMGKKYGVVVNRAGLGNKDVYEYLKTEKIALLMEIPFQKEIAVSYSNGILISETNPKFSEELMKMVEKLIDNYGNSNHQR